jgi:phage shock protein A
MKIDAIVVWDRLELEAAVDELKDKTEDPIELGRQGIRKRLKELREAARGGKDRTASASSNP